MMLNVTTYKNNKQAYGAEYKTYRYPCFDSALEFEGLSFDEKFNKAFDVLKREINEDRNHNDMTKYGPIVISDVFLS